MTTPSIQRGSLRFAVVTDTHANPDKPVRLELLPRIFASIERHDPAFVLNCGDITDYGDRSEYDAYLSTVPQSLRERVWHVPGNHEVRWDVNAAQLYRELFGPAPYRMDRAGLQVVGLDPTQLLQEPGHFGAEQLRWLAGNLRAATPGVLFLHFPLGADHYHLNDQDAFFETVAGLPVRAVFAGHVHRETVYRFNGFTQVTAAAAKNDAVYYWVERHVDGGHPVLAVTTVRVAADGSESRQELTTIPLSGNGSGRLLEPGRVIIDGARDGTARVRVEAGRDGAAAGVRAQVYPQHVFGARAAGSWVELEATGRSRWFSGDVDVADLPPGRHRMQLRVSSDGATHESTRAFEVPAGPGALRERWTATLAGSVQGALAERDGVVVAGSTGGEVAAFDAADGRERWRRELGPVYRGAAYTADGAVLVVPSADHRLTALDAVTGEPVWDRDLGAPVLSTPLVTTLGSTAAVVVSAGRTLSALAAADGGELWSADLGGFFAGRAACDGERVYAGSGDGYAYAFDAGTGERAWAFNTTARAFPYGRLLYGPWDDTVELLPGGLVLFATVARSYAVDRASGAVRWDIAAGCMYPPTRATDDGLLLLDEWGRLQLVDPASGTTTWRTELGVRTLNAGPVVAGGTAWVIATTGLLAGVDPGSGEVGHRRQIGPANTFSTPAVTGSTLVVADQDGTVRGLTLPQ
ncbi:3',5'-cyclic AMP phosphodiesterase CpdA [Haloactinopolyspora alba]|uniref:3',5'-cyclic AMP phosphodiesterase CpdA n=1 Tax=Haloactinopolyspora alba TaxID=648780 RepID=A0A2P8E978_9ACTN|nr:PQQ-binding-like beta-propeller repeat protein [Haloactinopolyspora alba]PSL06033.1 3',5'-cyclic AMP phosphodiesterase CpdA [Haloactinopolyspora alba]